MNITYQLILDGGSTQPGLLAVKQHYPHFFSDIGREIHLEEEPSYHGFCITSHEGQIQIRYSRPCDAFRALGVLFSMGELRVGDSLTQSSPFESVGVMLDVSRNGVFTVQAIESLFCKFALLGINSVQLYMEDTFVLPNEPFFGYGRGAYTHEELRQIDNCGREFGIDVIPCIQTLGHLEQILQWPAYSHLSDVRGVLLADEPETYLLIGKMLDAVASCFRTKRIHIGMDEAHGVGTGAFLRKNGWQRPFDILNRHLDRVTMMCEERGLQPMIWSDMYFRIGSSTNDYYDRDVVIPEEVITKMSPSVELVYWDYYHADPAFYAEWIRRHRATGKEPVFAGGAWSWGRFWTHRTRWQESISAGMQAARSCGLSSVFLTVWGDDGWECHPFSVLPAIQYFAEWAYSGEPCNEALQRQFAVISPATPLAACHLASNLDEVPSAQGHKEAEANYSKWILWHDPLLGFLNMHLTPDMPGHYRKLADQLDAKLIEDRAPLQLPARLARTLQLKTELHLKLRDAYLAGDQETLRDLFDRVLPATLEAIKTLREVHGRVWQQWFKPFGWEVLDRRYGGILARLQTLEYRLREHLDQPDSRIPELEMEPLLVADATKPEKTYFDYARAATPSYIK